MQPQPPDAALVERLAAHRTVGHAPRRELEWLATHGTILRYNAGDIMLRPGDKLTMGTLVLFTGHLSHRLEHGGTWRKVIEWRGGDVTGLLPYSRMVAAPGMTMVEATTEGLSIAPNLIASLPVECPVVTAALVHVMLDRARTFRMSDAQEEKMASLGKLAAGLAHELNNPASAAARSATLLPDALARSDAASRALGAAKLTDAEVRVVENLRQRCLDTMTTSVLTPLERSDREEAIADWLLAHDQDESFGDALAGTSVAIDDLDALAAGLAGEKLSVALRWVAAGCAIRSLVRDIDRAATRVHQLVSAVKGFTYMGHATAPEPVDLRVGLSDTLTVLAAKARSRGASLTIDTPDDLPRVPAYGGELNQVWMNLIDNALDAAGEAGRVVVSARREPNGSVVVRVVDNGPGIPADIRDRIFDPFFTTKPVGQGTGLGLEIVRRLVGQNSGLIDVESVPGRTEFRVTLTPSP